MSRTSPICVPLWKRALGIAAFAALGALTVLLLLRDPYRSDAVFCGIRALTGYFCPACGGTRAMYSLLHLDILGALRMNAMLTVLIPLLGYIVAAELVRTIAGRYLLPQIPLHPAVVAIIGGSFLLFGVLRNVPALFFLAPI